MRTVTFWLGIALVGAAISWENDAIAEEMTVSRVADASLAKLAPVSLIELREQTMDGIRGQSSINAKDAVQARDKFLTSMSAFKSKTVKSDALLAAMDAEDKFKELGESMSGSGLDVILSKLTALETEVKDQQTNEKKRMDEFNVNCRNENKKQVEILTLGTESSKNLRADADSSNTIIQKNRREWRDSRNSEDSTHKALVDLQTARLDAALAVRAQVDERNVAIDVMQQALFLVCERFRKFRDGEICMKVKSQPDVAEPRRYETPPLEEAEEQDKEAHSDKTSAGEIWGLRWKKTMEEDIAKENSVDPENPTSLENPTSPNTNSTPTLLGESDEPKHLSLAKVLAADDGEEDGTWKLTPSERKTQQTLAKLGEKDMPDRYKLPLVELAVAIGSGAPKRSKSIVAILMEVLAETRADLKTIKSDHTARLDNDYDASWQLKETLNSLRLAQDEHRSIMEDNRQLILQYNGHGEVLRIDMKDALKAKHISEDQCNQENEVYGVEEAWRLEDLENLVKLKSILRMLYHRKKPENCPKHMFALCSGMDRGMCVFTGSFPDNEQRCSCEVGFYGPACQYTMCPGISTTLYEADAEGVCSTIEGDTRGRCDKHTGTCTCYDGKGNLRGQDPSADPNANNHPQANGGFYHGPKLACEYKNAPASKNGEIDNECSGRGDVYINKADPDHPKTYQNGYDKERGLCHCDNKFWGPGCQFKKCPHSNGNLYPSISANACNGRGSCSDDEGMCTCKTPYHCGKVCGAAESECSLTCGPGESCRFENCPDDCRESGSSACDMQTGKCSCKKGTSGPACEFF